MLVGGAQVEVSLQRIHTPDAKTSGLKSSSNLDEGNANLNEEHQTRVDSNVDQFVSNIKRKSKKTVDRYVIVRGLRCCSFCTCHISY